MPVANAGATAVNMTNITHVVIGMRMTDADPEVTITAMVPVVQDLGRPPAMRGITDPLDVVKRITIVREALDVRDVSGHQVRRLVLLHHSQLKTNVTAEQSSSSNLPPV